MVIGIDEGLEARESDSFQTHVRECGRMHSVGIGPILYTKRSRHNTTAGIRDSSA